jgi:HxlR-like helix-turn-helix
MPTAQLRELEADGMMKRTIYPKVPPRVEYEIASKARSLQPVFDLEIARAFDAIEQREATRWALCSTQSCPSPAARPSASRAAHGLQILTARIEHTHFARDAVAAAVPGHYTSEKHMAHLLERLRKAGAAAFIREKSPETKSIRSGDLGEILAIEYIGEETPYTVPIKRLRWKDHRNMAMRGRGRHRHRAAVR